MNKYCTSQVRPTCYMGQRRVEQNSDRRKCFLKNYYYKSVSIISKSLLRYDGLLCAVRFRPGGESPPGGMRGGLAEL